MSMQAQYITCKLPSNGLIYPTKEVHIRPKTIFDIKALLGNAMFDLQSEINALQNCISPEDNIDVYELTNQDVVYLLYKLRSLSDDNLTIKLKEKEYNFKISDLQVRYLSEYKNEITLPDAGVTVVLGNQPIKNVFRNLDRQREFLAQFPDYKGDVANTVSILDSIDMFDGFTEKNIIKSKLEELSFKDSITLINAIEKIKFLNYGVDENVEIEEDGKKNKYPIMITESFFRPTL